MINISTENKALYKKNNVPKQYKAVFADSTANLTHSNIIAKSVNINQQLSKDSLVFGSCNSSYITAKLVKVPVAIKGKQFTLYQTINNTDIAYGVYIVTEEIVYDDGVTRDIKAYDLMTKFDIDVSTWYNGLTFPTTLKAFRQSLCTYCGVSYENVTLVNDSMVISKTIDAQSGLIGRDVLKCCCEMNACFGAMSNTGKLKHIVLSTSVKETITKSLYRSLEYATYSIKPINKIQIHESEDDIGGIYGTGTNCYKITGNFLCYGKSTADLQMYAQNISTILFNIAAYIPCDLDCIGLPYLEMGDLIKIKYDNTELSTYVMTRKLSGEQALSDTISSDGEEYLPEETGVNVSIKQLKSKTNVLKRTVEGLSSQVSELDTTTGNQATAIQTLQNGTTALEQSLNGVSSDLSDTVADLTAEITRAKGVEANMYTKTQTDTKISQSATAIKNEVASTYTTKATFDSLTIGGRNLLRNSGFKDGTNFWGTYKGSMTVMDCAESYSGKMIKVTSTGAGLYQHKDSGSVASTSFIVGDKLCMHGYIKGTKDNVITISFQGSGITSLSVKLTASDTWQEFTIKGTVTTAFTPTTFYASSGTIFYLRDIKLEYGTKPTDWTPAPEDTDASIQAVDAKFVNYSTTAQMNTSLELLENSILAEVGESYATKLEVQTIDGKFSSYVLTSAYNTQVQVLSNGISAEVTAREEFESKVIGANVCDNNPITADDICDDDGETIVNQVLKDTNAKVEFLDTRFSVELSDNVAQLNAQWTVAANRINSSVANLQTNTSTQFEMLENEVSLRLETSELCNELNISKDGINFTGNRFTWDATNSSMTADGTLTCTNLNAINSSLSGKFVSGGTYGTVTIENGGANFVNGDYHIWVGNNVITISQDDITSILSYNSLSLGGGISLADGTGTFGNIYLNGSAGYITVNGTSVSLSDHDHNGVYSLTSHDHSGVYSPTSHIHYTDELRVVQTSVGNIDFYGGMNAASVSWVNANFAQLSSSDMRLKRDIQSVDAIEDFFMELKPKSYHFKGDLDDGYTHYGFLAQEVLSAAERCGIDVDGLVRQYCTRDYFDEGQYTGDKAYRIDYESLHAFTISMVQLLYENIMAIKDKIGLKD